MRTNLFRVCVRWVGSCFLTLIVLAAADRAQAQNYEYITNNGTITITKYLGLGGAVAIPSSINGFPVTDIGAHAFDGSAVTTLTIPNTVSNIEDHAFSFSRRLSSVTIANPPSSDGFTSIGPSAFFSCTNLTSVTLGDSVNSIGDRAFSSCWRLASITIPRSVTHMGIAALPGSDMSAINVDPLNAFYSSAGGVLFNKSQSVLVQFPGLVLETYAIPNTVAVIGVYAFHNCSRLTNVAIPNSVAVIEESAFSGCTGLPTLTIPNSVVTIGDWAFASCTSLMNLIIPDSVTSLGQYAFSTCRNLQSVKMSDHVTNIAHALFVYCTNLTSVTLGKSVTSIDGLAFKQCDSLTELEIPQSVTYIATNAFYSCTDLQALYFRGDAPVGQSMFYEVNGVIIYYLPGTKGWGSTFGGRPTAVWYLPYPVILPFGSSFGVRSNKFRFIVSWATNGKVQVEYSTNLPSTRWNSLATTTLTNGWAFFVDLESTKPARFYRARQR